MMIDQHFIVGPLAGTLGSVPYLVGLSAALRYLRQPPMALVLGWFVIGTTALSGIHTWTPRDAHLVPVIPALCILMALGLVSTADILFAQPAPRQPGNFYRQHSNLLIALATLLLAGHGIWSYFVLVPREYPGDLLTTAVRNALDLRPGETLVFIAHNDGELGQSDWLQPAVPQKDMLIQITTADVADSTLALEPGRTYHAFFHIEDTALLQPKLEEQAGTPLTSETLRDGRGSVIGTRIIFQLR
jgi:hypothetical protein